MNEVGSHQAAEIIGIDPVTVLRHVDAGLLPARREGLRRVIRIKLDDLRSHAIAYGYRFDEELAQKYAK